MWRYGEWIHCHKCQRSYHTWIYKRQTTASTFHSSAVYSLRGVSEHSSEQITIWHKNQIGLHSYFNFINMLIFSKYFNKCVIKTHELSLLCFILFHKLSREWRRIKRGIYIRKQISFRTIQKNSEKKILESHKLCPTATIFIAYYFSVYAIITSGLVWYCYSLMF